MNPQPIPTSFTNTKFEQLYDILLLIKGSDEYAKMRKTRQSLRFSHKQILGCRCSLRPKFRPLATLDSSPLGLQNAFAHMR